MSSNNSNHDRRFLDAALRYARQHQGVTGTNPSVACLIVSQTPEGPRIVGSGVTAKGGRPHAEPPALEEAGKLARGATAYVTLEPCAHHGKTPPCVRTLIDAGVKRVVTAISDPDSRVNGKGHAILKAAGIEVTELESGENVSRVMQGYLKMRRLNRPFVTLKMAMTENGIIGSTQKGNVKITGPVSIAQTHLFRARCDAIMIGSGTALADDPDLTCRLPGLSSRSPIRIALDTGAKLTEKHGLITKAIQYPTIVVSPADVSGEWRDMLARMGVRHLTCEMDNGHVALPELLDDLGARGIQSVLVEGGAKLAASFLNESLVDKLIVHVGAKQDEGFVPGQEVYAPFTPQTLPAGFEIREKLHFGSDQAIRLEKKEA